MQRTIQKLLAFAACALCVLPEADAAITVFNDDLPGYQAAAGADSLYLDFETDKFGFPVPSVADVEGNIFSNDVTYSTPSAPSSRVNISNVGAPVFNEIGPYGTWDGILRWNYTSFYRATGFTGVEVEPATQLRFYNNNALVGSTAVGGNNEVFQFFGFISDVPFNRVELEGTFYAIDAHRSTRVPEPTTAGLALIATCAFVVRRSGRSIA